MTWDNLHDEDVLFEFTGTRPEELTEGRFYIGTVDGFAEFGVFINIGENVTGLLHRSKLDQRLESLDWDVGDEVIVQVASIKENGDIDLDWSIRQSSREFRGSDVDGPTVDEADSSAEAPEPTEAKPIEETEPDHEAVEPTRGLLSVSRVTVDNLNEYISSRVRVEGRITEVRQTSGPTIFTLTDESGAIDCAAFESAGVRAYPAIEEDDYVRLIGVVEQHRGENQIEVESLEALQEDDREVIATRLTTAAKKQAEPDSTELLISDEALEASRDEIVAVATAIREAILAGKRTIIRHPNSADDVIAAAAIERAARTVHGEEDLGTEDIGRWVERRPMDDPWYELGDAMYDHGAVRDGTNPLIVLVGAGTSVQDDAALSFLDLYDIEPVIIDANVNGSPSVEGSIGVNVPTGIPTTSVATAVAGMVAPTISKDIMALPAISCRSEVPPTYAEAANSAGIDGDTILERRQAIALIAYYQRYDAKRELVDDLLFNTEATALAEHISAQYRTKIATAVDIAQQNADRVTSIETTICTVNADEYSHRYDFPPYDVLASELQAAEAQAGSADVVAVFGTDTCYLAGIDVDQIPEIATSIESSTTDAAVNFVRDRITFLSGKRNEVQSALVEALSVEGQ